MKEELSARQLGVAAFTGLLAPATATAGLDWRGALLAVPVVLTAAGCWKALSREGDWTDGWKGWWGKGLASLYIMWAILLGGAVLGRAGARMTVPVESGAGWVALLVWVPMAWLGLGRLGVFGRGAEIFYLGMLAALAFTLGFGAAQMEPGWLLKESGTFWKSLLCAAGTGCFGVMMPLLWERKDGDGTRQWFWWSGGFALVTAAMSVVTNGVLSPMLAAEQERPFFIMTVGLGRTARVEGLVSSVWLLADVTLVGMLLQCCQKLWNAVWEKRGSCCAWICAFGILAVGVLLRDGEAAGVLLRGLLPVAGLVLGGVVPAAACLAKRGGKRKLKKDEKRC